MLSWAVLRADHGAPELFYSPSQPRAADGKWSSGGGSSSGGSPSAPKGKAEAGIFNAWAKGGDGNHTWSDKQVQPLIDKYMATEKVVSASPEAAKRAQGVYDDAVAREPKISASVTEAVADGGGKLERFDFRLKGKGSMARKIETIAQEEMGGNYDAAAADIKDAVRYTAVVGDDGYWASGSKIQESLKAKGWTDNGAPAEGWSTMFRGRMLKMKDENGYPVEVQVHTNASLEAAEIGHYIYNANRLPGVTKEHAKVMDAETLKVFNSIPVPTDLPNRAKFTDSPSAKPTGPSTSNAQRLANAKKMYSPGSKKLEAAIARWS